jgi:VanZ family protein
MNLPRSMIVAFRLLFILSLLLILFLATIKLENPILTSVNDKLGHILAFAYLAFLLDFAMPDSNFNLLKIIPLFGYGLIIEFVQYFLPYRTFSILDMLADGVGIMIYLLIIPLLKYVPFLKRRWLIKLEAGINK